MSVKVFISYKHVEPDRALAIEIHNALEERGHEVFIDTGISVGKKWGDEIKRNIEGCDYFVVLLSEKGSDSDAILTEVRTAYDLCQKTGRPVILPIRANFHDSLNHEMAICLDSIQQLCWKSVDDNEFVISQLVSVLGDHDNNNATGKGAHTKPAVFSKNQFRSGANGSYVVGAAMLTLALLVVGWAFISVFILRGLPLLSIGDTSISIGSTHMDVEVKNTNAPTNSPGSKNLDLSGTDIENLDSLTNLDQLQQLNLRDTRVNDLTPLTGASRLEYLNLRDTPVQNLDHLANLHKLQRLDLRGTQVGDLSMLAELIQLKTLYLNGVSARDLGFLENLRNLERLYLGDTQIVDLGILKNLKSLQTLDLSYTRVADLGALTQHNDLQLLYLRGSRITDLSGIEDLGNLRTLNIRDTEISEITKLIGLIKLERLDLRGTKVDPANIRHLTEKLPNLKIKQ
ncbi:MAG: TIR domain-containing protein [Gammaproteobacteria bacterium]|nr:TIR domain-containing protein [Gammaproteobacteria bacterium]